MTSFISNQGVFHCWEEALKNPGDVVKLVLEKDRFTELPDEIGAFSNLEFLDLTGLNRLSHLRSRLRGLKKLKHLRINSQEQLPDDSFEGLDLESLFLNLGFNSRIPQTLFHMENLGELELHAFINTLPPDFSRLKNLRCLLLFLNCVPDFPGEILELPGLQKLHLTSSYKNMSSLPEDIHRLTNLEELKIRENLETLPEDIGKLANLRVLRLPHQSLTEIPASLNQLKNLRILELSGNKHMKTLPTGFGQLDLLEELHLAFADKMELPWEEVLKCTALKKLDLTSNKNIMEIPAGLGKLENLEELRLGFTDIDFLPDEVFDNLHRLRVLVLNNTRITTIPSSLLAHRTLTELNLSDCWQINDFPAEIWQQEGLTYLNLHNVPFKEIPPEISNLVNLEEAEFVPYNEVLKKLSPEIGCLVHLKKLWLGGKLSSLPPEIGQMSMLEELDLCSNKLTQLPPEIGNLTRLRRLNLDGNPIKSLPPEIGNLINLAELHLQSTSLDQLPPTIGKCQELDILSLNYNHLQTLPEEICNLEKLRCLYISENQLKHLPEEIGRLQGLRYFSLEKNKLQALPDSARDLPIDCEISLLGNYFLLEEIEKLSTYPHRSLIMPREKIKKKKAVLKKKAPFTVDEDVKKQLERLGIPLVLEKKDYQIEREGMKIVIPATMYSVTNSIFKACGKKFYYDLWGDGPRDFYTMKPSHPKDFSEHPCNEIHPYFSLMSDQHYSYYLLRADDENPANPRVYFIDHDDYESDDASETASTLSGFLEELKTIEEVNRMLVEDDDCHIKEIGLLAAISSRAADQVESINATDSRITTIAGLERYINLERLVLNDNEIQDLSPLWAMKRLEQLEMRNNRVKDLSPLQTLAELWNLRLGNNKISDIGVLRDKVKLKWLELEDNDIEDISALEGLIRLDMLNLKGNRITDISPLSNLKNLQILDLDENPVIDLSPLAGLQKLESLNVNGKKYDQYNTPLTEEVRVKLFKKP